MGKIKVHIIIACIIRIYHECEGRIEISPEDHCLACRMRTNGDPEGQIFLSHLHSNNEFFSCPPLNTTFYALKMLPEVHEYAEM